jgi:hypothetical protein
MNLDFASNKAREKHGSGTNQNKSPENKLFIEVRFPFLRLVAFP